MYITMSVAHCVSNNDNHDNFTQVNIEYKWEGEYSAEISGNIREMRSIQTVVSTEDIQTHYKNITMSCPCLERYA